MWLFNLYANNIYRCIVLVACFVCSFVFFKFYIWGPCSNVCGHSGQVQHCLWCTIGEQWPMQGSAISSFTVKCLFCMSCNLAIFIVACKHFTRVIFILWYCKSKVLRCLFYLSFILCSQPLTECRCAVKAACSHCWDFHVWWTAPLQISIP